MREQHSRPPCKKQLEKMRKSLTEIYSLHIFCKPCFKISKAPSRWIIIHSTRLHENSPDTSGRQPPTEIASRSFSIFVHHTLLLLRTPIRPEASAICPGDSPTPQDFGSSAGPIKKGSSQALPGVGTGTHPERPGVPCSSPSPSTLQAEAHLTGMLERCGCSLNISF